LASDVGASVLKKVDTFKTIYSNKTFDYMSCEKPILLAIDGVSRELVNNASCGEYVEPENIDDIVRGIKKLASLTSEETHKMGDAGYKYAKQYFDREVLAKNYIEEIKKTM
jgi:glycosyltransferase involved in cell wall biosynthesis